MFVFLSFFFFLPFKKKKKNVRLTSTPQWNEHNNYKSKFKAKELCRSNESESAGETPFTPHLKKKKRENADYDNTKPTHLNSINHMKTIKKKKEIAMSPICIHSLNARRNAI